MKKPTFFQKYKYLSFLPALFIIGMIFRSSSQTYKEQDLRPLLTQYLPIDIIKKLFNDVSFTYAGKLISIETVGVSGFVEFFLRKGAHFGVFFVLSLTLFIAIYNLTKKLTKSAILTFIGFSSYAIIDETHQGFTGGRSPLIQDVFVDISGGTTALCIILVLFLFRKK